MEQEYDFSGGVRGPIRPPREGSTKIQLRVDDDVLEWYRARVNAAGGGDYGVLMNRDLRLAMQKTLGPDGPTG